jgi:ferredoxin-type protein NapH
VQIAFTALSNGYAAGFLKGKIYTGDLKKFCLPGLNCYSCPGALGSCPIGSLQAVLSSRTFDFSYYVVGFLLMAGALCGRFVCGWLCPFGLLQDLLYKIPFRKKLKKLPGDKWLRYLRYIALGLFVIILPLFVVDIVGQGSPWFCEYICPSGTFMAGIPLALLNTGIRGAVGLLFDWKVLLLVLFVLLSVVVWRPFCRYLCPLGAIYGPFNKFALLRFKIDGSKCTDCGACQRACKMDIPVHKNPNSAECVRCGDCRRACPTRAIGTTMQRTVKKTTKARE